MLSLDDKLVIFLSVSIVWKLLWVIPSYSSDELAKYSYSFK